jgi:hypothetical protein
MLVTYINKNEFIGDCYIRHSAAISPQNLFLSDFDLIFFLKAHNLDDLAEKRAKICKDIFSNIIFRKSCSDFIVLPDTQNAYELCRQHYPFRSVYPIETWMPVEQLEVSKEIQANHLLPLDHFPEKVVFYYIIDVLRGYRKRHALEPFFLKRCVKKDYIWAGLKPEKVPCLSIYEALLEEINIWSQFYKNIDFKYEDQGITVKPFNQYDYSRYLTAWSKSKDSSDALESISSVWVYPASHDDITPNLVVNLKPGISAKACKRTLTKILKIFDGLDYFLVIGREESMIGRINGLSRLCLLDPWLFKYFGKCLFGNPKVSDKIIEPSKEMLKQKFREVLLFFSYEKIFDAYNYNYYKLAFILDHLFSHNEIILNDADLSIIYGPDFILKKDFNHKRDTPLLLSFLKDKHDFYLF